MGEVTLPWRRPATPSSRLFVGVPGAAVMMIEGSTDTPTRVPLESTFAWGDCSRATINLAYALLSHSIDDWRIADALSQPFANAVFAHVPANQSWTLSDTMVRSIAAGLATP